MVDDAKKDAPQKNATGDAKRRMDDRTVPVPVPRGGTRSADTLESDPQSFIGKEHLRAASNEPAPSSGAQTRGERPAPHAAPRSTPQPSFDEEIAKNRAPAPRPATVVRRSPLGSVAAEASHPEEADAGAATSAPPTSPARPAASSDPSPSSVFSTRASAAQRMNAAAWGAAPDAGSPAAVTAAHEIDASIARAAGIEEAEPAPILSGAPHDDAPDDDAATLPIDAPTFAVETPRRDVTIQTAPAADPDTRGGASGVLSDSEPTLERTAALPAASVVPASDPAARLPDRLDSAERARLANEATRVRSATNTAAPSGGGTPRR
jgi:hypothetical protein